MRIAGCLLPATPVLAPSTVPAAAQTLEGRVLDGRRHQPIEDARLTRLHPDGRIEIDVFLLPRPYELEGVEVRVQREQERRKLRSAGFYERAAMGFGVFVTPDDIGRQSLTVNVSDYMRGIPGINFYGGLVLMKTSSPSLSLTRGGLGTSCGTILTWTRGGTG